jgi:hypothetical protein
MKKSLQLIILLIALLLPGSILFAQEKTVSGTVLSEENKPLEGVTVTVKGTNRRTQTNSAGYYTIPARPGQSLIFTFVGFGTQEVAIGQTSSINLNLSQKQETLSDVVVVGYGTQRRGNLTGAVSTVNVNKTLGSRPITDVARGLQGSVPG